MAVEIHINALADNQLIEHGKNVVLEPGPNWTAIFDPVGIHSVFGWRLSDMDYKTSELVIIADGGGKVFFRFSDVKSARLFALQFRALHSFFFEDGVRVERGDALVVAESK